MSQFAYIAFDTRGQQAKGTLAVADQMAAMARLKEMGYFPTRIIEVGAGTHPESRRMRRLALSRPWSGFKSFIQARLSTTLVGRPVKPKQLTVFTRQLATLLEAGMPLLRGLRLLQEQERQGGLKRVINDLAASIEGGSTLSEGLAQHPKVFNGLYVNMVKAGEIGGVLEVVLKRLADFMERAQKIKGKIVAASFYPAAVMFVAMSILALLMVMVVPKFKEMFEGLLNGRPLPTFTVFVLQISTAVKSHFLLVAAISGAVVVGMQAFIRTPAGRRLFDGFKLRMPAFGRVLRKLAIARFTRTFGTLAGSGVPILQALTIVRETSGNMVVREAVTAVHDSIKQGETIAAPLRSCQVFPARVVGMVDIGEQTGALPEMLMKIADTYDEEVDNAVTAMTSLLEPILIVFLAVVVGCIVIAMFLPLIDIIINFDTSLDKTES